MLFSWLLLCSQLGCKFNFMLFHQFIILLPLVSASVCDNGELVPFTGFKFVRENRITVKPFRSDHFLKITHCNKGRVDFTTKALLDQRGVNETFCIAPHMSKLSKDKSFFAKLKRLGSAFFRTQNDHGTQPKIEEAAGNTTCYKVGRRRNFAKSDTLFFIPYTFIGVLYECNVTFSQRQQLLMHPSSTPKKCDNPVPIEPIVAEDASKTSLKWHFSPLSISQSIPYLKSASPLDPRFNSDLNSLWKKGTRANEDYNYNQLELHRFLVASSKVAKYISSFTKAPFINLERWFGRRKGDSLQQEAAFANFLSNLNTSSTTSHFKMIQSLWL